MNHTARRSGFRFFVLALVLAAGLLPARAGAIDIRNIRFRTSGGSPEERAREFLASKATALKQRSDLSDLLLERVKESPAGPHVRFRQTYRGLPVFDGEVNVHLSSRGDVYFASTSYKSDLNLPITPSVSPDDVRQIAIQDALAMTAQDVVDKGQHTPPLSPAFERGGEQGDPQLGIEAGTGTPRLVYRIWFRLEPSYRTFRSMVDARTGEVLERQRLDLDVDGLGQVFDPNPVVTTGDSGLTDNGDADSASFTPAYFQRTLPDLGGAGPFTLTGPFVTLVDIEAPANTPPSEADANNFIYTRSNDQFEDVMLYYHLDRNQRYIQSLGFVDLNNRSIRTDAHGLSGADNSHYVGTPVGEGYLAFGDGGVDDAEDADIILHEYGHSLQDNASGGHYLHGGEAGAMGEGFGDYWAGSNATGGAECFGDWDSAPGCLRRLNGTKHYPEDVDGEVHDDGEIWSAALWDLFGELGKGTTDPIVLLSHFLVADNPTFKQGAQALLDADAALNDGANSETICDVMEERGILDGCVDLGFVIDDTGSMSDEIDAVKGGLQAFLTDLPSILPPTEPDPLIELTTFKDSVTSRISSRDQAAVSAAVGQLFASGGDDCPEFSLAGLFQAAGRMKEGGSILFATDASPNPTDPTDFSDLLALLAGKSVRVHVILTGDCDDGSVTAKAGAAAKARKMQTDAGQAAKPTLADAPAATTPRGVFAAPSNDDCDAPIVVPSTPYSKTIDISEATVAGNDPTNACASTGHSVWFTFTPSANATIDVSTAGSTFDTVLAVYTGSCGSLAEVTCDDDSSVGTTSAVSFAAVQGTTYHILTGGFGANGGTLKLSATERPWSNTLDAFSKIVTVSGGTLSVLPEAKSDPAALVALQNRVTAIMEGAIVPSVVSVNPYQGPQDTTLGIEIEGSNTNFGAGTTVAFSGDGIVVDSVVVHSPTTLLATITIGAGATIGTFRDVTVLTLLGGAVETAQISGGFQVTTHPATPTVLSISPSVGVVGTGVVVTIFGANTHFGPSSVIDLGTGVTMGSISSVTPTSIEANVTISPSATLTFRDVAVTTGAEVAVENVTGPFRVVGALPALPAITQISPTSGTQGDTLTIDLTTVNTTLVAGVSEASFSGADVTVTTTTVLSPTSARILAHIDAAAAIGFRDIRITTNGETAAKLGAFRVLPPEDTGFIPPDKDAAKCEGGAVKVARAFMKCIMKCHTKQAEALRAGKAFDGAACERTDPKKSCRAAYDKAGTKLLAKGKCPACLQAAQLGVLADRMRDTLSTANAGLYCSGTSSLGTNVGGLIPPDKVTAKCEAKASKITDGLAGAIFTCHVKRAIAGMKGSSTDDDACEDAGMAKYDKAGDKIKGCPDCLDRAHRDVLRDQMEFFIDQNNGLLYCAGTASFEP